MRYVEEEKFNFINLLKNIYWTFIVLRVTAKRHNLQFFLYMKGPQPGIHRDRDEL